jgi:DNA topoisomerase-3
MTAEWEEKLLRIEKGEYAPELFMQEISEMVQELVSTYEPVRDPNVLLPSHTVAGRCPHCGAEVIETAKGWECMGKECRFMIWKDNAFFKSIGARMTGEMAEKLISTGEVRVERCVSRKSGKEYPAIISLDLGPDGSVRYKMRFPDRKKKEGGTA